MSRCGSSIAPDDWQALCSVRKLRSMRIQRGAHTLTIITFPNIENRQKETPAMNDFPQSCHSRRPAVVREVLFLYRPLFPLRSIVCQLPAGYVVLCSVTASVEKN
jgi:hypothetical protein